MGNYPVHSLELEGVPSTAAQSTTCTLLRPKDRKSAFAERDPGLAGIINAFLQGVRQAEAQAVADLFHPRLRLGAQEVAGLLRKAQGTLGKPVEVSLDQLFALRLGADGRVREGLCAEKRVYLRPHYGYPLQWGLFISLVGQQELGHFFVTIVPFEGRWVMGSLHYQQVTHGEKDASEWLSSAGTAAGHGQWMAASLQLELAYKLADAAQGHLRWQVAAEIERMRAIVAKTFDWQQEAKARLQALPQAGLQDGRRVVDVATIFAPPAVGLRVRVELPRDTSSVGIRRDCQAMVTTLKGAGWAPPVNSLRCGYLVKGEDPGADGRLGSFVLEVK